MSVILLPELTPSFTRAPTYASLLPPTGGTLRLMRQVGLHTKSNQPCVVALRRTAQGLPNSDGYNFLQGLDEAQLACPLLTIPPQQKS